MTLLDVRPAEECTAGHLPDAIKLPIDRPESHLSKLPKRKKKVAYCRGPRRLMSFEAVMALRKRGLKARRLENGSLEWRAAGLPFQR